MSLQRISKVVSSLASQSAQLSSGLMVALGTEPGISVSGLKIFCITIMPSPEPHHFVSYYQMPPDPWSESKQQYLCCSALFPFLAYSGDSHREAVVLSRNILSSVWQTSLPTVKSPPEYPTVFLAVVVTQDFPEGMGIHGFSNWPVKCLLSSNCFSVIFLDLQINYLEDTICLLCTVLISTVRTFRTLNIQDHDGKNVIPGWL